MLSSNHYILCLLLFFVLKNREIVPKVGHAVGQMTMIYQYCGAKWDILQQAVPPKWTLKHSIGELPKL